MTLRTRAWLALAILAATMGLLLFGTAGTTRYWQAWLFLAAFLGPSVLTTLYLMENDPALLARRMRGGPLAEREPTQRLIMWGLSLGFVALLVVPGLDRRLGWSALPPYAVLLGDVLVVIGLALVFRVYRENTFTAATIEVAGDQRVVDTGPYAVVRHPMYAGGALYLLGTPLALGSCWALLPLAAMTPLLLWRLVDEERVLARDLPGYTRYRRRVRYRLVPWVW